MAKEIPEPVADRIRSSTGSCGYHQDLSGCKEICSGSVIDEGGILVKKLSALFAILLVLCLLFMSAASAGTSVSGTGYPEPAGDKDLLQRLLSVPAFKFYHHQNGIGYGVCPVYTAPSTDAFRTSNGKASVSTNYDLYECGYTGGWLLVRYGTNNGGTNVGYIPPNYVHDKGFKSRMEFPEFDYIPVTANDTIYVTNNPLLRSSYYAVLDPGEVFYILGKYNYHEDWWYIECIVDGQIARGFIDRESSFFTLGDQGYENASSGIGHSAENTASSVAVPGEPALSPLGTPRMGKVTVNPGQRKNVRALPDTNSTLVAFANPGDVYPAYASQIGNTGKTWYYVWIEKESKWGWISEGVSTYSP